jgi:hypothetical protein
MPASVAPAAPFATPANTTATPDALATTLVVIDAASPASRRATSLIVPAQRVPFIGTTVLVPGHSAADLFIPSATAANAFVTDSRSTPAGPRGAHKPPPSAPTAPTSGFSAVAGAGAAGFWAGGAWAAVLVTLLGCCAASARRPHRLAPALWRPLAFVSIQERPG